MSLRLEAVRSILTKVPQAQSADLDNFKITVDFGGDVFTTQVMKERLSKKTYKTVINAIDANKHNLMDSRVADEVAEAMKTWAVEKGATHYTHWFQPLRGMLAAEKHESFLTKDISVSGGAVVELSGKSLVQGEPDASSFPTGGLRSTFEARGYTVWDPASPAFIRRHKNGNTLCIPTAFCSWTGVSIDNKTPLLRSEEMLAKACKKMLQLLEDSDDNNTGDIAEDEYGGVFSNLGIEQEFFLVDRSLYLSRPDLAITGRTLIGAIPTRGQELEDHYFGSMPARVLAYIQELEKELWRLGVPQVTRHNEVAPAQFEMAPIFENGSLSVDHNVLEMDLLRETARSHGLECLLHEKPFAGVNGSGKHNNWSISTQNGINLLDPGLGPLDNFRFMLFLAAVLKAVDEHADLLRCSVATPGNDHRLGANEAPPAIISVFIGSQLTEAISMILAEEDEGNGAEAKKEMHRKKSLRLGVQKLPVLLPDETDRNRTSPFAFTGNKFEFRAVGSEQHCARPLMTLNAVVTDSLNKMHAEALSLMQNEKISTTVALRKLVRSTLEKHQRIIFDGNNYSDEWKAEAAKRGLPNYENTPQALERFDCEENIEFWSSLGILNKEEILARAQIWREDYATLMSIECRTLLQLVRTQVLPAAYKYQALMAHSITELKTAGIWTEKMAQNGSLVNLTNIVNKLVVDSDGLEATEIRCLEIKDQKQRCTFVAEKLIPGMNEVRESCDKLEDLIDDAMWPLAKYRELCFMY